MKSSMPPPVSLTFLFGGRRERPRAPQAVRSRRFFAVGGARLRQGALTVEPFSPPRTICACQAFGRQRRAEAKGRAPRGRRLPPRRRSPAAEARGHKLGQCV